MSKIISDFWKEKSEKMQCSNRLPNFCQFYLINDKTFREEKTK